MWERVRLNAWACGTQTSAVQQQIGSTWPTLGCRGHSTEHSTADRNAPCLRYVYVRMWYGFFVVLKLCCNPMCADAAGAAARAGSLVGGATAAAAARRAAATATAEGQQQRRQQTARSACGLPIVGSVMGPLPPASASRPTGTAEPVVPVAGDSTRVRGPRLNHADLAQHHKTQGTQAPRPVSAAVERAPSVTRWHVHQGPCGGLCCSAAQACLP